MLRFNAFGNCGRWLFAVTFISSLIFVSSSGGQTSTNYREVSVKLEVRGNVVATNPETEEEATQQNQSVAMSVQADFEFEELVQQSASKVRAIRKYKQAAATIELGDEQESSELQADNQFVLVNRSPEKPADTRLSMASLAGQLTQREWQLLETPISTLLVNQIIDNQELELGSSWQLEDDLVADLLTLDYVSESNVQCKVSNEAGGWVEVSVTGSANGADDDVNASARLMAKLAFQKSSREFRKAEITLRQRKDEGQIGPGFNVLIKMAIDAKPLDAPKQLTRETIAKVRQAGPLNSDLQLENPARSLALIHPRRWRSVINSAELSVLRLLQDGQVMGQCNIVPLTPVAEAKDYTMEEFQASVEQIMGDSAKMIDSETRQTEDGLIIYDVELALFESSIQLARIYTHVMDSQGNRAMVIFTTEAELVDSIRSEPAILIESLVLRNSETAASLRKNYK